MSIRPRALSAVESVFATPAHASAGEPVRPPSPPKRPMDKLRLDIDSLQVETFDTDRNDGSGGTVNGNAGTLEDCGPYTGIQYGCQYVTAAYDCCAPDYTDDEWVCGQLVYPSDYCSATTA